MTYALENWLKRLAYTDFPEGLLRVGQNAGTRPYASEIEEMLAPNGSIRASAVFCVEEQPTVCFVEAHTIAGNPEQRLEQIRQRVWNQSLASVVLVLDSDQVTAYAVNDRTAEPDLLPKMAASERGRWSAYEVQSGFIKDRLSDWFVPDERVDRRLLANLREVVKLLTKRGLSNSQAEALMAQVIFLCYLEQRGVVGHAYRERHGLDVLESYVVRRDGSGVDRLLKRLSNDFNGDFLSSRDGGAPTWADLPPAAFLAIEQFLDAVDIETGQGSFWRYDFSHIPVELISGIYETLLKDRQGKLGAYYTPRHLANLVTEQAFQRVANLSNCSVYDGACGSGILLTTAFRRMLRHIEATSGQRLGFAERVALMQKSIFGNDLDETACWITAFSLYLSLLEGLEPSEIARLQSDEKIKLPKLIGKGLNIQKGTKYGDFFSSSNPFAGKRRFDVFLCNPPWRESDDDERPTWEEWCRNQDPAYPIGRRQIAAGFVFRAMQCVHSTGVVALILPLNLVIGATSQSCEFRQRWLEEAHIDRIINFGDVRRLLFPAAKHPCAVVFAQPRSLSEETISLGRETVEYWTPKADVSLALGRLALHAVDRKLLRAREIYERPHLLISSYWGERRDLDLLKRLHRFGTVAKTMESRSKPWLSGKGFHAPNNSNKDRKLGILESLAFLPADELPEGDPFIAAGTNFLRVRDHYPIVASPGGRNAVLYTGPRVLFPDGLTEGLQIKASFSDEPFAFTSSVGAIGGSASDGALLKLLAAYLRSPLASYLMVMTSYSVIGERPRVALDDIETFPFCSPEQHPNRSVAERVVSEATRLMGEIQKATTAAKYAAQTAKLYDQVYDYFELSEAERLLVQGTVDVVAKSIQPPDYLRLATPLLHRPSSDEVKLYANALAAELSRWRTRNGGAGALEVTAVVENKDGFFGAVQVKLSAKSEDRVSVSSSDSAFHHLLRELQASHQIQADSSDAEDLFKIPNVMVVAGDAFFFVKPMRRRFWLERSALADADHIVQTVHSAAWAAQRNK